MIKKDGFLTLYCDPGEDFGWALGYDFTLVARGIHKMWPFADEVWAALNREETFLLDADSAYVCENLDPANVKQMLSTPIHRIVSEDFRIYPWKQKALKFDPVRTARVIGALTFMARLKSIDLVLQPAAIKPAAVAAGAEELYDHPLHENRHSNDAIQHFVFYTNTAMRGIKINVPNEGVDV